VLASALATWCILIAFRSGPGQYAARAVIRAVNLWAKPKGRSEVSLSGNMKTRPVLAVASARMEMAGQLATTTAELNCGIRSRGKPVGNTPGHKRAANGLSFHPTL